MLVDVQFLPSASGWPGLAAAAGLAEDLGYTRVWLFDHLAASSLNVEAAMLECCTTLGALAAVTSRIGLGTLVANVANRYPAVLALAVATAQHISGGRVVAGLGAGAARGRAGRPNTTLPASPSWPTPPSGTTRWSARSRPSGRRPTPR